MQISIQIFIQSLFDPYQNIHTVILHKLDAVAVGDGVHLAVVNNLRD